MLVSVSGDCDQDDSNTTKKPASKPPKAEKSEKGELSSVELHLKEAPCIIEVGAGPAAELSPYYSLPIATLPSQARGLWTKTNFPCSDNFQNWQA